MTQRCSLVGMALIAVGVFAGESSAQSGLPTVYVQAGPAVSIHAEGEQYHRASPPLEGATIGGALAVGARLSPVLGVEASVTLDGKQSGEQTNSYFTVITYTAESRDLVFDVNLRFRPRGGSHLEFTAGGGWAYTRFAQRNPVSVTPFPPSTVRGADVETSAWAPTLNGAMAVAITLSPRLELVPSVGARWIRRGFDTDAWYLGVGRYSAVATVALRLRR